MELTGFGNPSNGWNRATLGRRFALMRTGTEISFGRFYLFRGGCLDLKSTRQACVIEAGAPTGSKRPLGTKSAQADAIEN